VLTLDGKVLSLVAQSVMRLLMQNAMVLYWELTHSYCGEWYSMNESLFLKAMALHMAGVPNHRVASLLSNHDHCHNRGVADNSYLPDTEILLMAIHGVVAKYCDLLQQ
jgi:hypothetical protein